MNRSSVDPPATAPDDDAPDDDAGPAGTAPTGALAAFMPAGPHEDAKARIAAAVDAARTEIIELSHRIHAHPEPAYEEVQAATWVATVLRGHGYAVEHPAGSLATAIRATRAGGRGGAGPRIGILAEYDALPGLGHGCGHNTMAASGVGAAIALAAVADELPGEIVFLGTPAEERGSGKKTMIDDGLFDGVDAALLFHPCDRNHVESQPLASEDVDVVFHGLQAHAAADPWRGRNALDAMILLFSSVGLWRQQLRTEARVHGIIQEGGTAANIIPERTRAWFMLRSPDQAYYEVMKTRFRSLVDAAALATETTVEISFSGGAMTMKPNATLEARWVANAAAYGIVDQGPDGNSGSTDMGNVSWVCPTIHPELSIAPEGTPGHSILFRDAAVTPAADATTLLAATLVAQTAYELFADPELVAAAWRDFRGEG
ncbi:MAG TPA: M20 family metallopeptidase [Candidatus Limnocylindrales bacterium]|nr:M20 family metallopeptidase [Candidatus Limnocylindrales bacterium]